MFLVSVLVAVAVAVARCLLFAVCCFCCFFYCRGGGGHVVTICCGDGKMGKSWKILWCSDMIGKKRD